MTHIMADTENYSTAVIPNIGTCNHSGGHNILEDSNGQNLDY